MSAYDDLSDEEKQQLHDDTMTSLTENLTSVKTKIAEAVEEYKRAKEAFNDLKKKIPLHKEKAAKTRLDEIEREMYPLEKEREMELAATKVDRLRAQKKTLDRDLKLEKLFTLE